MLTDFSKAFDYLSHELLITKLHAYGFDKKYLLLVCSYSCKSQQCIKINDSYNSWSDILFEVPQGSIIRSFLFNYFYAICFTLMKDFLIASYGDESTLFIAKLNQKSVVDELEISSSVLFNSLETSI